MKQQNVGNRKITIWMIPLILICGVLLSALISMDVSIRSAYERAKIVLNDSAYEQMDIFHAKLEGQFSVLQAFADYCVTADEDEAELQRLMGFIAAGGEFHHIGIIDPRTAVARVNTGESFSVKDRSYFTEAMSGKTAMDTIEKNRVDQMALVVLSVPVYRNDKIVAVVFGSYDTEKFSQLLTAGAYNRHSYSFVCDATGQLIVGSTSSAFLGTRDGAGLNDTNMVAIFEQATLSSEFSLCQFIDNLRNGVGGAVAYDVAGNRRYAIYQPMGINDWFIFNVVDEVLIDQEVKASTGRNLAWIGIIVGFSLLALLFLLLREK
ncbi:MAG: cache domain-containing protein, partial [Clostridiales bacterium]